MRSLPVVLTLHILFTLGMGLKGVAIGQEAMETSDQVKIAAVQILGYDKTDVPRPNYSPSDVIVSYIHQAGEDGAQLVVFPEYVLGHITVPSDVTRKISAAAEANRIYVIVGCWEDYGNQAFANAALLFDRSGKIIGKYFKTHAAVDQFEGEPPWVRPPTGKDREWFLENDPEWMMEAGEDLPVFELDFGTIGILTCYDGWFPESCRVLSLKGAELLVWINGRRGSVEDFIVKASMFQNHVAMVCTNQAYGSGTMIADWPTQILAECSEPTESYITATINLAAVRAARENSRNFRQRRPALYGKIVDPTPYDAKP